MAPNLRAQSNWQVRQSHSASSLNAVVYGNGLFVAVGEDGMIVTSPDGIVWTPRLSGTTDNLPAIACGNGRFVATRVTPNSPAITSADGIDWTPVTVTNSSGAATSSTAYQTIAFGDGRFLAAGPGENGGSALMGSSDGVTFKTILPPRYPAPDAFDQEIESLNYFRGQFYGFADHGGFYASADAVIWKEKFEWGGILLSPVNGAIATDQISKVALVAAQAKFSVDAGNSFRPGHISDPYTGREGQFIRAACYGAASFAAVDSKGCVWLSERGEYWRLQGCYASSGEGFRSIAFDGTSRFVAVGSVPSAGEALIASSEADPPTPAPQAYRVSSLKHLANGTFYEAMHITNLGRIAGTILISNHIVAATAEQSGTVNTHGMEQYSFATAANASNDNGTVAAEIGGSSLNARRFTRALELPGLNQLYSSLTMFSTARAVNSADVMVGKYYSTSDGNQYGIYRFDYRTRQLSDLGNFGMLEIEAMGIDESGTIAGTAMTEIVNNRPTIRPFRLSPEGAMTFLPGLGGSIVYAVVTNGMGDIAGTGTMPAAADSVPHALMVRNGMASDIDTLNTRTSDARSISDRGEVVGNLYTPTARYHAFIYSGGRMHDLNSLLDGSGDGWVLTRANGINNSGHIVGEGTRNGDREPFLAVPTSGPSAGTPTRFVNVSTRLHTGTGDNVLIAGLILKGGAKRVVVRALGPALTNFGNPAASPPNLLADPTLELLNERGERVAFNDDYAGLSSQEREAIGVVGLGLFYPTDRVRDSVIMTVLPEGSYTAIVRGSGGATGNCLVEVYNVDTDYEGRLVNIATRGPVGMGDNVMIAGFIVSGDRERRVIIRGIGPSLGAAAVPNALEDTTLEIFQGDQRIGENDNWRSDQESQIIASGIPPNDDRESAIILSLWPGTYTAILRGKDATVGNGLVEVYELP